MNVASAHYHSLLGDNISILVPTLRVSTASDKWWGEKPWVWVATLRTSNGMAAVQFIPVGCPIIWSSLSSASGNIK